MSPKELKASPASAAIATVRNRDRESAVGPTRRRDDGGHEDRHRQAVGDGGENKGDRTRDPSVLAKQVVLREEPRPAWASASLEAIRRRRMPPGTERLEDPAPVNPAHAADARGARRLLLGGHVLCDEGMDGAAHLLSVATREPRPLRPGEDAAEEGRPERSLRSGVPSSRRNPTPPRVSLDGRSSLRRLLSGPPLGRQDIGGEPDRRLGRMRTTLRSALSAVSTTDREAMSQGLQPSARV